MRIQIKIMCRDNIYMSYLFVMLFVPMCLWMDRYEMKMKMGMDVCICIDEINHSQNKDKNVL